MGQVCLAAARVDVGEAGGALGAQPVQEAGQLGKAAPDEWVVIEPAYQAAQLLERLHDDPQPGNPLLGRFALDVRY